MHRAQSVVSQTLANLEAQLGVTLFDRSDRYPRLTVQGVALLHDVRSVTSGMDGFKAKARPLSEGLEPDLAQGLLKAIQPEMILPEGYALTMSAEYRRDAPPGPARRWFLERLRQA